MGSLQITLIKLFNITSLILTYIKKFTMDLNDNITKIILAVITVS